MKPLPKWFGIFSVIVAIAPTLYASYQAGGWHAVILAIVSLLGGTGAVLSHSVTGTGGTISNP